jgi:Zn-dependent protease
MKRNSLVPIAIVIGAMVVLNMLDGNFSNFPQWIYQQLLLLPGIIIGLSFHEFAHGIVSYKLGDPTPKVQGRLTLNPMAHIDPIGFLCLFFAGFGWGIPVEIDPRYYKHRRRDELMVSLAGVLMNLLIAILFMVVIRLLFSLTPTFAVSSVGSIVFEIVRNVVLINLVLMVFNLIPVPPLDGFGIITEIFNLRRFSWYETVYQNGIFILLALILFNVTDRILTPLVNGAWQLLTSIILTGM